MKKIYYLTLAAMLAGASATGMASAKKFRALASPNAFSAAVAKKAERTDNVKRVQFA